MKKIHYLVDSAATHKQILCYINIRTNHGRYCSKMFAMVCPDIDIAFLRVLKYEKKSF